MCGIRSYKCEALELKYVLSPEELRKYDYVILNLMSSFTFEKVEELEKGLENRDGTLLSLDSIPWMECLEAWFFRKDTALHIFEGEDGLRAIRIEDAEDTEEESADDDRAAVLNRFRISEHLDCRKRRFDRFGKVLVVKEYLQADQDGQMCVSLTRPVGIEK